MSYEERFDRVISYLYDHLDDDIDFNRLAEIACLSPYHWHRIYQAMTGETIAATVKRLRLHRAAGLLANSTLPVGDVAARSGYANVQSFTRIFRQTYGMPPAQFRREGSHAVFRPPLMTRSSAMFDVAVKTMPALNGLGVDHTGPYMEIGKAFETLVATLAMRKQMAPDMQMVGIFFDDPSRVPEPELRSRACMMGLKAAKADAPLVETKVAGGTCAVLRFKGHYSGMRKAYDWLFGTWVPQSGRETADAAPYEIYVNNPREVPPEELLTDICIPLKG